MEITNHKTGDKCVLNFKPCGLFGKELHKVEGYIQDKSKKKLCALYGKWTECLYSVDPATFEACKKNEKKNMEEKKSSKQLSTSEESDEMPMPDSESVFVIPGSVLLWRIAPRPPNSAQMYNFTSFAMVLNEVDKEMESVIPKTDCRLRPDIRAMENGEIDQASEEKNDLKKNKEQPARTGPSRKRTGRQGGSAKVQIHTVEPKTGSTPAAIGTETIPICLTFIKVADKSGCLANLQISLKPRFLNFFSWFLFIF